MDRDVRAIRTTAAWTPIEGEPAIPKAATRRASAAVLLALAAVAGAAIADTLRGSRTSAGPPTHATIPTPSRATATPAFVEAPPAYPRCRRNQLRLVVPPYGATVLAYIRHVRGPACRVPETRVRISARGPHGENPFARLEIPPGYDTIAGNSRRGVTLAVASPTYELLCARPRDRGKRFVVRARGGQYTVERVVRCPS
jgi:hypothetical protein